MQARLAAGWYLSPSQAELARMKKTVAKTSHRAAARRVALRPRKLPSQDRSKASIARILQATRELLKSGGTTAVTTPNIAAQSGVSVGSIYQYFPNKEAIIHALYETKLAHIRAIASDEKWLAETDWQTFFGKWIRAIKRGEALIDYDLSMNEAIQHYPGLAEVSQVHVEIFADIIAGQLKRLGSRWPDDALFDVAVHAFFLNSGTWLYWSYAGAPLSQGIDRLVSSVLAIVAPAMDGSPPPKRPYARRRSEARTN
jgi:AcrR family transcriptional regulator